MSTFSTYRRVRFALAAAALAVTTACGSGQSSRLVPATPVSSKGAAANVTFTMHWTMGSTGTSASARRPQYVPATARSVGISVNGSTPQFLNSPATTLAISAPAGVDTFTIQTFDEQNGVGNVLSKANITQTVVVDTANVLSATLNGVIASLKISLGSTFKAGTAATASVNVAALDADGNTIVGPGDYSSPIQLSIVDPASSGTLSLDSALIQTPGQTSPTLSYSGETLVSASVVASASGVSTANAAVTPAPTIYEYPLTVHATAITRGPDGNMWFTAYSANKVGYITPGGNATEYDVPTSNAGPDSITAGSDGALWFTENTASQIGRIPMSGPITEVPTAVGNDHPSAITDGHDGLVWYGGNSGITYLSETTGATGHLATSFTPDIRGIVRASDQNLYFTEYAGKLGQVTTLYTLSESIAGGNPIGIVFGPDGNLWYCNSFSSAIVKLAPGSSAPLKTFLTPTLFSQPGGITVGSDGALWFTEGTGNAIGRITTSGAITEYPVPTSGAGPDAIATGPDGSIWFTESSYSKIGRLVY
jgi:streptogramin lyase